MIIKYDLYLLLNNINASFGTVPFQHRWRSISTNCINDCRIFHCDISPGPHIGPTVCCVVSEAEEEEAYV